MARMDRVGVRMRPLSGSFRTPAPDPLGAATPASSPGPVREHAAAGCTGSAIGQARLHAWTAPPATYSPRNDAAAARSPGLKPDREDDHESQDEDDRGSRASGVVRVRGNGAGDEACAGERLDERGVSAPAITVEAGSALRFVNADA